MIHRVPRLAWGQQEEAAEIRSYSRFRNYGLLAACRAVAESPCNPLTSRGSVSLPIVHPRLLFYGPRCGAPGAEAGDRRPVGAAQDQHVGV